MNNLLLVRHAETDLRGTFCGHSDPPLNNAGTAQLPGIVQAIGNRDVDLVISSDLQRAQQTATFVAKHYRAKLALRVNLREMFFGEWEGLRWEQIEARDPQFAQRWIEEFPRIAPPGGQSIDEFESRVKAELIDLSALAASHSLVVVSHAGVIRAMLTAMAQPAILIQEEWAGTGACRAVIDYGAVIALRSAYHPCQRV